MSRHLRHKIASHKPHEHRTNRGTPGASCNYISVSFSPPPLQDRKRRGNLESNFHFSIRHLSAGAGTEINLPSMSSCQIFTGWSPRPRLDATRQGTSARHESSGGRAKGLGLITNTNINFNLSSQARAHPYPHPGGTPSLFPLLASPLLTIPSPPLANDDRCAPAGTRIYVHGNRPPSTGRTRSMLVERLLLLLHGALQLAPLKFAAAFRQALVPLNQRHGHSFVVGPECQRAKACERLPLGAA
jgi:hypothetical protein